MFLFRGPTQAEKDASLEFKKGEQLYIAIKEKELSGSATVAEIKAAIEQLRKGAFAPEAGSAPLGKHFAYSRTLHGMLRKKKEKSEEKKPGPQVSI